MPRMKKGADAIFSEVITPKSEVGSGEDRTSQLVVITKKPEDISHDLEHPPYNLELLIQAINEGEKNSRISLWSPKVRMGLLYLSMTTPRFSMSDETRQMLEEAFEAKYPELNKKLKEELDKRRLEHAQSK